jgi:DNA adenine methylase
MRYWGGKARLAKPISKILTDLADSVLIHTYWEPFVGSGNVIAQMPDSFKRRGSDISCIIAALKGAVAGHVFPTEISKNEFKAALNLPDTDPNKAFIRHAMGFSGNFWGRYCPNRPDRHHGETTLRGLMRKANKLLNVELVQEPYNVFTPKEPTLIYCDPPYAGTVQYGPKENKTYFDSGLFWAWAERMSSLGHVVVVSEYAAPETWKVLWEKRVQRCVSPHLLGKTAPYRVEKLFTMIKKGPK